MSLHTNDESLRVKIIVAPQGPLGLELITKKGSIGTVVKEVNKGSVLENEEVSPGDLITAIDNEDVRQKHVFEVEAILKSKSDSEKVLTLTSPPSTTSAEPTTTTTTTAVPSLEPSESTEPSSPPSSAPLGVVKCHTHQFTVNVPRGKLVLSMSSRNNDLRGLVVNEVCTTSVLLDQVSPGDEIIKIDEEDVSLMNFTRIAAILESESNSEKVFTLMTSHGTLEVPARTGVPVRIAGVAPSTSAAPSPNPPTALLEGTSRPSAATGTSSHIGLTIQPGPITGLSFSCNKYYGARVTKVAPTSAYGEKFEVGDCIVMVDGQRITKIDDVNKNSHKERVLRVIKSDGRCCVEICPNKAKKDGLCKMHHDNGSCSHTDANGKRCENSALKKGGPCFMHHDNGPCNHIDANGKRCESIALKKGGRCGKHANVDGDERENHKGLVCGFEIDGNGTKCESIALTKGGRCGKHGDPYRCITRRGALRCIRDYRSGSGGICRRCLDGDTEHPAFNPISELFERIGEIQSVVESHLSPSQTKVMKTLQELMTKLWTEPFQAESFSVNGKLSKLVRELMDEYLTDDKYQNVFLRRNDNINVTPLPVHVHDTLLKIFKAFLRDFSDGGMAYMDKVKLSEEQVTETIDRIICLLEKTSHGEDGVCMRKVGSGSDRTNDNILYPALLFKRNEFVGLGQKLPSGARGLLERLSAISLIGVGIGVNVNLPTVVPETPDSASMAEVYVAPSTATNIVVHVAEHAIATRGVNNLSGFEVRPKRTMTDTTSAATEGTTVAASTSADSTTASNTSDTTGRITDVATPTPADSVQQNQTASHGGEEVPTPTEPETFTLSHQDESDDVEYVEFSADRLDNDNNQADEDVGEGEGGRNTNASPITVTADLSTFGQNSEATSQIGHNNCSKSASETAVINGSAESVNITTRKRESPSENLPESPPKIPRQPNAGAWQPSNPPANAHDYLAIKQANLAEARTNLAEAQTRSTNRGYAIENYQSRLKNGLMGRNVSLDTIWANESKIDCMARIRVTGSDLVPSGLSQNDCDYLQSSFAGDD